MTRPPILSDVFNDLTDRLEADAKAIARKTRHKAADPRSTLFIAACAGSVAFLWFDGFDGRPRIVNMNAIASASPILQAADIANEIIPRLASCRAKKALISLPRYPDDDLSTFDAAERVAVLAARAVASGKALGGATAGCEHIAEWEHDLADKRRPRIVLPAGTDRAVMAVIRLADAASGAMRYGLPAEVVPFEHDPPRKVLACNFLASDASTWVH